MNLQWCQDFLGVPVSPVVVKTVTVNMLSTLADYSPCNSKKMRQNIEDYVLLEDIQST